MVGWAIAIGRLANQRVSHLLWKGNSGVFDEDGALSPISRKELANPEWRQDEWPASREYYRILDRIARGEQP